MRRLLVAEEELAVDRTLSPLIDTDDSGRPWPVTVLALDSLSGRFFPPRAGGIVVEDILISGVGGDWRLFCGLGSRPC